MSKTVTDPVMVPDDILTLPPLDGLADVLDNTTPTKAKEAETMKAKDTDGGNVVEMPTNDLDTLQDRAGKAAHILSAAYSGDSLKRIREAETGLKTCVDAFNAASCGLVLDACLAAENSVRTALDRPFWRKMVSVAKESDGVRTVEITYKNALVDLVQLDKAAGARHIMHRGNWQTVIEALTLQFAMRATKDIGGDIDMMRRTYDLSEYARDPRLLYEDGKRPADPTSNRQLVAVTQKALDAILFENGEKADTNRHRVTTHDVNYILYTCFKKGKDALTVTMPRPATITAALTMVAYRIINGYMYSSEYKRVQKVEANAV